jgi:hypothetical protein
LVAADEQIEIHEYALQRMVRRHLEPQFRSVRRPVIQYYTIKPLLSDLAVVLSVLAQVGGATPAQAAGAFSAGVAALGVAGQEIPFLELASANLQELDAALGHLAQAAPALKRRILEACARAVAADARLEVREAELLRAIADALDCPLPPCLALQPAS